MAALASAAALLGAGVAALGSDGSGVPAATAAPQSGGAPAVAFPATRFALAGGCFELRSAVGRTLAAADGPYRMQATALGQYLFYGVHSDELADPQTGSTEQQPSAGTVWRVDGPPYTITNTGTGESMPVTFAPSKGCAVYPEAQVDATGTPFRGASPTADVLGAVEGHAHITAFELFGGNWHCGRLWSPFGAPYALPASCADDQQGTNGLFEAFFDFGGLTRPSDFHGWPTFKEWPEPTTLAEEEDYYTGIERAWRAGLRLMVTDLVDNEALCQLMTTRTNPCNDMASVHIQSRDLYGLQDYIDAQSGGPGKGWLRVVTDPFQARQVINQGKLAVIEGIEVSRIFGCGETYGTPQCNQAQVDAGLKEVQALGVRTFFPVHEFDNAFGGSKMINGEAGIVINAGNREVTGSFFTLQPCPAADQDAPQVTTAPTGALAGLLNGGLAQVLHGSPLPVYGTGPQCNTRGLTPLGQYLIHQMIRQHLLIQLDHMDSKTADAALAIAQDAHYSGVISAHCCSSPQLFKRIYATGGFISPPVMPAKSFVATWQQDRAVRSSRYHFGFGYGSDMEGLGTQPGPANGNPITYPFKSFDGGTTLNREQWGQRTFDLNTDGLANYGLYADWLNDLQTVGGRQIASDMFQGAEAYLETWERAEGVPPTSCRTPRGTLGGGSLRLGSDSRSVLFALGQPASRPGSAYRYCVRGAPTQVLSVVFGPDGRAELWGSNARGYEAGGVHPGDRAPKPSYQLKGAPGIFSGKRGEVFGVLRGRVSWVAQPASGIGDLPAALRSAGLR